MVHGNLPNFSCFFKLKIKQFQEFLFHGHFKQQRKSLKDGNISYMLPLSMHLHLPKVWSVFKFDFRNRMEKAKISVVGSCRDSTDVKNT